MTTIKGPSPADLRATLARQMETLVRRLAPWTPGDWEAPSANPGWSNRETATHLLEALSAYCTGIEQRGAAERPKFGTVEAPPLERLPWRLGDVGRRLDDLLEATEPTARVWHLDYRFSARTMAAVALSEVVLHRWDLTGPGDRGPEPRAARLVLQGLFSSSDDSGASPTALLLHLSGRVQIEGRPGWSGPGWRYQLPDAVRTPGRANRPE